MKHRRVAPPPLLTPPSPTDTRNSKRQPRVRQDTWFSHPPERVWKALTDGRKLSKWLLPTKDDIEPRVGHRFGFTAPDGGRIACEVLDAEPGRRLAFTWQTEGDAPPSRVTWTLSPVEGGTRLLVEQDGAPEGLSALSGGTLRLTACLASHVGTPAPLGRRRAFRSTRRPPLGLVTLSIRSGRRTAAYAISREVTSCR
jgi:uncharacterized protein YndB with AHSA1/START domain